MTLAQIPEFGFFVQNSRIGVKIKNTFYTPNAGTILKELDEFILHALE